MINTLAILLTVCFVVMKVAGIITWGWLLCFSPFLILLVFDLAVTVAVVVLDAAFYGKAQLKAKLDDTLKTLHKKKN